MLGGCTVTRPAPAQFTKPQIWVTVSKLTPALPCTNTFIPHTLDHTTGAGYTTPGGATVVPLYESNGSGVAINDLDNDGDLDIVLANLSDPNTILWNQGNLTFLTQRLPHGDSRAVNIVDVDGDGQQDIVFTRRFAKPTFWRNSNGFFVQDQLPDVHNSFYSMDWGDLDRDGDLDLVAGSYDTELRKRQGGIFDYHGGGVGVFFYERQGDGFVSLRLAEQADALALALPDLNGDGRLDILVGNDFDRPDYAWLRTGDGWQAIQPFASITENTMSFDVGDIDNDGSSEIFATDMKPYRQDEQTLGAWQPLMAMMSHPLSDEDPQVVENVLQVRGVDGRFENQADRRVLAATGWSWSSKFGDLDNDGYLDVYVVNGMIADGILSHLTGNELVEENQALRNDGRGYFEPVPEWGLGATESGRGMSMADLDNDGDLDIVVNNLVSPAQLFENRLCGGSSLEVDLRRPESKNPYAIGAQLTLYTSAGKYYRTVRASSGYLSGDPVRVHFGVPVDATPQQLEVVWPDGLLSTIDSPRLGMLLTVSRKK